MLIPVYPGRPAIVEQAGCRVYLSLHDAAYLAQKAIWKQQLREAHPDTQQPRVTRYTVPALQRTASGQFVPGKRPGARTLAITSRRRYGSSERFRRVLHSYRAWKVAEQAWYAQWNIVPPDGHD